MNSSKFWFLLLLIAPFVNILSFKVSETLGLLAVIIPFGLFVLSGRKRKTFKKGEKTLIRLSAYSLTIIFVGIFFSLLLSIDNFYYYRFFFLFFFLIPIFLICGDSENFIKEKLLSVLKYYIILITISILLGAILKLLGLDHMEPMYDVEKWSYLDRPFGIFGQPSVNSCLLCFFYLFHRAAAKLWSDNYIHGKDWLFIVVTIGVVFQGSGSGFLSYAFVLLSKFSGKSKRIPWTRLMLIGAFIVFLVYQIALSGLVEKISVDYITILYDYVYEELIDPYIKLIKTPALLMWGIPDFPLSIDLGPLFMMGTVGLIMTIFIFVFLLYMLRKSKGIDMKLGFVMLIVGNLHYPVMFYMIMHFMWYIVIYYILVIEKRYYFYNGNKYSSQISMNSGRGTILLDNNVTPNEKM